MAEAIEWDRTRLHHVEGGRPGLSIPLVIKLADLYGMTVKELVYGEGGA